MFGRGFDSRHLHHTIDPLSRHYGGFRFYDGCFKRFHNYSSYTYIHYLLPLYFHNCIKTRFKMAIVKVKLMKQYTKKDGTHAVVIYVYERKPQYVNKAYSFNLDAQYFIRRSSCSTRE